jgi:release factor glutamine methyltransferase
MLIIYCYVRWVSYNHIISKAPKYLQNDGWLIVEHGYQQGALVKEEFTTAKFVNIDTICDYALHQRITIGQYKN